LVKSSSLSSIFSLLKLVDIYSFETYLLFPQDDARTLINNRNEI